MYFRDAPEDGATVNGHGMPGSSATPAIQLARRFREWGIINICSYDGHNRSRCTCLMEGGATDLHVQMFKGREDSLTVQQCVRDCTTVLVAIVSPGQCE